MADTLATKTCTPCKGGIPPLTPQEAEGFHRQVSGWDLGFPRGFDDDLERRHSRPAKYSWTEHAERNAIYAAARAGIPLAGCKMYVSWFPCADCARAIIQAGIMELIAVRPDRTDAQWGQEFEVSIELLKEARISVRYET